MYTATAKAAGDCGSQGERVRPALAGLGTHAQTRKGHCTGTHRLVAPAKTLLRIRPLMPAMGITRIANITGLDCIGVPVVMVCRPNARSLAVSQGKGLDLPAARASGLMEAVELYHAEHITRPLKLASWNELGCGHTLVDVDQLPKQSVSRFHANRALLWIEGYDLLSDVAIWVPFELVHANYTLPLPAGSGSFVMSSNGLASGNHVVEAISHGICEVIERDATTLWSLHHDARDRTRLDLDTVDDSACQQVLAQFARADVAVAVWDITSDIGVPVFYCTIVQRAPTPMRLLPPASGVGCHPSRDLALLRALTEAAQSRLTQIAGSRDDVHAHHYRGVQDVDQQRQVLDWVCAPGAQRCFGDVATFRGDSFVEDVSWILERLHAAGIRQVVYVDLTRPEFAIPVVRVVIPGLEGIHEVPGYVPGARARRHCQEVPSR